MAAGLGAWAASEAAASPVVGSVVEGSGEEGSEEGDWEAEAKAAGGLAVARAA